jgi:cytochrome c peroxidase
MTPSRFAVTDSQRALVRVAFAFGLATIGGGCPADPIGQAFCDEPTCAFSNVEWARLKTLTDLGPLPRDRSNRVDGDPLAIALGRDFFFDARFSGNATQIDALRRATAIGRAPRGQPANVSCASCHDMAHAGADSESIPGNVSSGAGWTDVNALPIVNCAYQRLYTWNGRADSLWAQAFAVAESPTTMNGNRLQTAHVILAGGYWSRYVTVFAGSPSARSLPSFDFPPNGKPGANPGCDPTDASEPFGDALDCLHPTVQYYVTEVLVNWAKAIAAYEATLVSRASSFDRFMREGPLSSAISSAAKNGARLFVGKAGCIDCHATPLFSDGDFHDVGVPQKGPLVPTVADCPAGTFCDCAAGKNCLPWGAFDGLTKLRASAMLRSSRWSDDWYDTSRSAALTRPLTDALKGAWRTPSLRNVALTAPYMHDGVFETLAKVVDHYNRGGDPSAVGTRAVDIKPIRLTVDEQADLVAFLETLTEEAPDKPAQPAARDAGGPDLSPPAGSGRDAGPSPGADAGPLAACLGYPPATPNITGPPPPVLPYGTIAGAPFVYVAPGLIAPMVSAVTVNGVVQALDVAAYPGTTTDPTQSYLGFGLPFAIPACLDASAFTGVRFTVEGALGTCTLTFSVVPSEDNSVSFGPVGTCAADQTCLPPSSGPIGIGTSVVRFSEMTGGSPVATVDPRALNGVQWNLTVPSDGMAAPCGANLRISDVAFVSD